MNLYNKYRPTTWNDLIGQQNVQNTLQQELAENKIKHSYLFIGNAGVGKTATARIFANSLDAYVIELDMASHGTAEDMRNLIDSIKTKPIGYSYYVVILDEVQAAMSRKDSMAAQVLLKTLEEPPTHVVFILCTTEGDKIIDTIKSRCETLHFNTIDIESIKSRLKQICEEENIQYDADALNIIAHLSKGGMRQAITHLDSINSLYKCATLDKVKSYFNAGEFDIYMNLLYNICDSDIEGVLEICKDINENFIQNFFCFLIDISIYFNTKNIKLIDIPKEFESDISGLSDKDKNIISLLRNEILTLQYEGKNSPIIKQLFIGIILKIIEGI